MKNRKPANIFPGLFLGMWLAIIAPGISVYGVEEPRKSPETSQPENSVGQSVELTKEGDVKVEGDSAYLAQAGKFHIGDDPTVWVMIVLANLALVVTIERWWALRRSKGRHATIMTLLVEKLSAVSVNSAHVGKEIEKGFGLSGKVASLALKGWDANEKAIAEYAQSALIGERRDMEKRLVVLSTLGNNIPFIGLLGTVLGIMKAFRDLAMMGEAGPSVVMKGISEALIATAMGLAIAVPCVIAYNVLSRIVKDRVSQAEEVVTLIRGLKISSDSNNHNNIEAGGNRMQAGEVR